MALKSHKELIVYKRSMELVRDIYLLTDALPQDERFGLRSQLRRAACSIPLNIAEGYGRGTRKDYAHFISLARASALEVDTALELCILLGLLSGRSLSPIQGRTGEIIAMLISMRMKLLAVRHHPLDETPSTLDP